MEILETLAAIHGGRLALHLEDAALWSLSGADRVRFLNGQVTNDVMKLPMGQACAAAVCTAKGKMQGFVHIAKGADALWIDSAPSLRETLRPRIERYIIADDAVWTDITESWQLFHFLGETAPSGLASSAMVFANQRFGLPGHDVWLPAGEKSPDRAPFEAWEIIRLREGIPAWGKEMNEDMLPPEAGLNQQAISYAKGCYIGQETISRIKSIGRVNKLLCRVENLDGKIPEILPMELSVNGDPAGILTSAILDPETGKSIGLAILSRPHHEPGTSLKGGPEGPWHVTASYE